MTLSVGFRITVSLLILLPKLRGSDSYPGGTVSHRTRQPSLDAQRQLRRIHFDLLNFRSWPAVARCGHFPVSTLRRHSPPAALGESELRNQFIKCRKVSFLTRRPRIQPDAWHR